MCARENERDEDVICEQDFFPLFSFLLLLSIEKVLPLLVLFTLFLQTRRVAKRSKQTNQMRERIAVYSRESERKTERKREKKLRERTFSLVTKYLE